MREKSLTCINIPCSNWVFAGNKPGLPAVYSSGDQAPPIYS